MDCQEARENILESLTGQGGAGASACQHHIANCETCAALAETQRALDARMTTALLPASLSPDFRTSLKRAIRRDTASAWPDSLPDLAHLIGCVFAVIFSVAVLPQHAGAVIGLGAAFTAVTWLLQGLLRSSLEVLEGDT